MLPGRIKPCHAGQRGPSRMLKHRESPLATKQKKPRSRAGWYSLLYGMAASGCAVVIDLWLLAGPPAGRILGSLAASLLFVLLTAVGLYFLLRRVERESQLDAAMRDYLVQAAAVFDSTQEGVLITDAYNQVVHVNPAFTRITGYSESEIRGQNPRVLKSGYHDKPFYDALWSALVRDDVWQGEIWNRRKSGDIYPQWQTLRVLRNEAGEPSYFVAVFSDLSAIKRSEDERARLVHYDPLTGLPNRLLFMERLGHAFSRLQAEGRGGALMVVNLDHFRHVNESYGHAVGDEVLRATGKRLAKLCDGQASLYHLGADEFALLYEKSADPLRVAGLAESVLQGMLAPCEVDERTVFVQAYMGISLFPQGTAGVDEVLRNATTAYAEATRGGRPSFAFYTEELTLQARHRLELCAALRLAVEREELVLYYQPIHDLRNGSLAGVESLVRWQSPARGLVPPGEFIPLAEEMGLIAMVDAWVMGQACAQMQAWRQRGLSPGFVAVNVSSRLFGGDMLLPRVEEVLAQTGMDASLLEIEVTESAIMDQPDRALAQLDRLHARGVRLALDDFGTGYSSLLRLKLLPLHKLKIDQGFVRGLPDSQGDRAIVLAIISLAHQLGLKVLAEGVETQAQLDFLVAHGCDLAQGYFFGRPVPADVLFPDEPLAH